MRKWLLFCLIILGLLCTNKVKASELTDDYFDIATNYYNANNLAKSLEYLDLIISIEPDNLTAKNLRDKICPPRIEPQTTETKEVQAPGKVTTSEPGGQTTTFETPPVNIEKITYDADYYNTKGLEFYDKKEYDTSIEYFYKALALNKRYFQAYNNLGMAYWAKNNTYAAIKYFKKAHFTKKAYTQPLVNLSNLYKQLGDTQKQVCYLKKAIKYNCNDYLAYYWLGDYYKSQGEYPKAILCFKEVIKINPKYSQAYLSLAICFFETEDFNYTLLALSQYKEFYPNSDFAFYLTARAYLALNKYEDAKKFIEKAIQIKNIPEYQFELAKIDYTIGNYQSAIDIFQSLLKTTENAEYFNYVGLCNYKLKDNEIAIANFKKAIDLDGLRPIYYYNLAQCYKSIGDKKNYLKYVNTATKISPINFQDFIDLSYIYYDNGNTSYAINMLNSAIQKYPDLKSLYLAKLKIYEATGDNLHYNEIKNLIEMRFNQK